MEAAGEPDDLEAAGVQLGQLERDLVGLRAGVQHDQLVERLWEHPREPLGERKDRL